MRILFVHLVAIFLIANPVVCQAQCCCINSEASLIQKEDRVEDCDEKSCCALKKSNESIENSSDEFRAASCRNTSECCCFVGKNKSSYLLPKIVKYESNPALHFATDSQTGKLFPKTQVEPLFSGDITPPQNSLSILYCVRLE